MDELTAAEVDTLFKRLDELKELGSKNSTRLRQLIIEVKQFRELKRKITETVRQNKTKREEANKELQKLFSELKPLKQEKEKFGNVGDPREIQARIDRIEWQIITEVIPFKKEQEMTKERLMLEEQLQKALERHVAEKDEISLIRKITDLRQEQKLFHSNVIANSKEWEKVDKELNEISSKIDVLRKELKPVESEIDQIKAKIGEFRNKERTAEVTSKERREIQKKKAIADKFEEVKEKFKKKKKLTTEDLLVIQSAEEELPLE